MKKLIVFIFVLFPHVGYSQIANDSIYPKNIIHENFPLFSQILAAQLTYPLSWLSGSFSDFPLWRATARAKVMECLLKPPPVVPFHPVVIAEQERDGYVARKIVFNITADSRVLGYFLYRKAKARFLLSCCCMIMVESLTSEKKKSFDRLMKHPNA